MEIELSDLAMVVCQLCIVQLGGKVDQEAAAVAVYPPLWCTDRVQY